ncbi:MAG: type VII secretion target [Phycicoccus sp.]
MSEYSVVPAAVTQTAEKIENVAGDIRATGGALNGAFAISEEAMVVSSMARVVPDFNSGVGSDIEKRADGVTGFGQTVRSAAQTYVGADHDVAASYGITGQA